MKFLIGWLKASEGAAMGTETAVTHEVMHGNYSKLPNRILCKESCIKILEARGGIKYSKQEQRVRRSNIRNHGFPRECQDR